jgi:hypothetical protein
MVQAPDDKSGVNYTLGPSPEGPFLFPDLGVSSASVLVLIAGQVKRICGSGFNRDTLVS